MLYSGKLSREKTCEFQGFVAIWKVSLQIFWAWHLDGTSKQSAKVKNLIFHQLVKSLLYNIIYLITTIINKYMRIHLTQYIFVHSFQKLGKRKSQSVLATQSLALGGATCLLSGSTFCPTSLHHTGLSKALGVVTTAW